MAKQTIAAFYDDREYANNAALTLRQAGIPDRDIAMSPETTSSDYSSNGRTQTGFWAALERMFGGTDDHGTYAEGVRHGGTVLVAHVDDARVEDAIIVLEQHGSVDLSERETAWQKDGWTSGPVLKAGSVCDTDAGSALSMTPIRETAAASQTSDANPAVSSPASSSALRSGTDDALEVVEETLKVGKRAINRGKVRLHSYVIETPVSEAVSLRDETVSIDRRPVDRALGADKLGADPFRDRTIEMDEIDEEAVVAKSPRVVEEIGIRKDTAERVETVNETVRSTKVDIEDGRTIASATNEAVGYAGKLANDMEVVGSDGEHVGVIDHVDGATIKLKRMDPASGGTHHLISTDWVESANDKIVLKTAAGEVKSRWTAA
jgi:uncharacterized protein (TIGR02271 family)